MKKAYEQVRLVFPGNPIPQRRPRSTRTRRGKVRVYNDQSDRQIATSAEAIAQMNGRLLLAGPLAVCFHFFLRRPKAHWRTGKHKGYLKKWAEPMLPIGGVDTSNLVKFYEDAFNGVVWIDDAQIVELVAFKAYENGGGPRTIVNIREVK